MDILEASYIHSSMKPYTSNINEGIGFDESVCAELELNGNAKLIVGCIYRSPSSDEGNDEKLYSLNNKVNECGATHILVVGDFNYPLIKFLIYVYNINSTGTVSEDPHIPGSTIFSKEDRRELFPKGRNPPPILSTLVCPKVLCLAPYYV